MVPVVAEGRREPLRTNHINRTRSGRGSDLFFWNLRATKIVKLLLEAALALLGLSLMVPSSIEAQDQAGSSNSGIRGTIGCVPNWGNEPTGSYPCGRVVDSKTGKDVGRIECLMVDHSFSKPLPEGVYTIHWEGRAPDESASVSVAKEKWTHVILGQTNCPPQNPFPQ